MIRRDPLTICAEDTMDHVERLVLLMEERDRHDDRRKRENPPEPILEWQKRMFELLDRDLQPWEKKLVEERRRRKSDR